MNKTWTSRHLVILKKEYPFCPDPKDLAKKLGRSYKAIKSKAKVLQLKRLVNNTNYGRTTATAREDRFILDNYKKIPVKQMASKLKRGHTFVVTRIERLGIDYPRELAKKFAEASRIKEGNTSPNKGKKQSEFMSRQAIERSKKTRFKKGNLPPNTLYDGAIRIRKDTDTGIDYQYIRVSLGKWEPLHRLVWNFCHGKIPAGHVIIFKDGNQGNCNINNLLMLTYKENMLRNSVHNYPKEITLLVQLRGALNRQINKHLKSLK